VLPTVTVPATGTGFAVVLTTVTGAEGGVLVLSCAELVSASAPINIAKPAADRTMVDSKLLERFMFFIFLFIFIYSFFEVLKFKFRSKRTNGDIDWACPIGKESPSFASNAMGSPSRLLSNLGFSTKYHF
jgi:hypothetical protein